MRRIAVLFTGFALAGCSNPDLGNRLARIGAIMQQSDTPVAGVDSSSQMPAYLKQQQVAGTSRICTYDRMGSPYVITVSATDLCPLDPQ